MNDTVQTGLEGNSELEQNPDLASESTSPKAGESVSQNPELADNSPEAINPEHSYLNTSAHIDDSINLVTEQDIKSAPPSVPVNGPNQEKQKQTRERIKKKPREPNGILIDCLEKLFNPDELNAFIAGNFDKVHKTHSKKDFTEIIVGLVTYCDRHGEIEYFWDRIKEIREKNYESWYKKWKNGCEAYQAWSQQIEQEQGYSVLHDQTEIANYRATKIHAIPPSDQNLSHPLTKDDDAIQAWFFNEL
ncbi:MAG: hypothetical protein KDI79_27590, partial [Anaerolineae bacterium]|nr:hypothetical protein [Anaerolineae bacterium]